MQLLDTTSIIPLYEQLKNIILNDIKEGKLKPNQKIPTEMEFSKKYKISRMTVRKALSELVDEGVLAKKQGKGTFVLEKKMVEDLSSPNSFTKLCQRNKKEPGGKTLLFVMEKPKEHDKRTLGLNKDEKIIHLKRIRTADNIPVMLENIYFPGHLNRIMTEDLNDTSLYQILQEKYGIYSGNSVMEISVCVAKPEEASLLQIKRGSPCLLMEEVVYDQNNNPLHKTKSIIRGDKFKYISPRMNVTKN
ncbi:GntR family transcriptional regulator [Blautia liquoris]|uniref:GntR family transcriptional regulator n=1 Tax=Blautia liquoris TaxID=2779518 RepID=A0A7M2REP2_9FIRM|nr:GntR family transcriptional regulator [Blautia liquoris]QOV18813.1 GntR family transcriptional regulator [Blautia liquoris]